ncbi:DUF1614 domain-containing protein [Thermosynechococcus vestitus]|uniref:Tlr1129 protein n=1 Tax=Thermosynechococcus vestitus (strain NIES-2133 / IAM M-273 / BP-1) TaxID=197221 RepID=Q8DJU3_THEVB|nr:DUF1614 domain-containing protein [Thermosynechococcus vestitus]BAC08681.1 tlr1129 [Thermosynechococcus vestitus BP-1]BAY52260.1 hypothetical protein NIES2134_101360 [Thermostichus vulcanus NIES-2134]
MIYLPVTALLFVLLLLSLPFLWLAIAFDAVQLAVAKLGFSPTAASVLLLMVILGSTINIPLYERVSTVAIVPDFEELWLSRFWGIPLRKIQQKTIVALNVGGGLIPTVLALYQFTRVSPLGILLVTLIVAVVSYYSAQVVPGIGIQMNALVAPLTAAMAAILISGGIAAAPIAFAGGVLGTLIGADLLHLREIERMSAGVLSIGGAGVFDGIALCGLFALLLT